MALMPSLCFASQLLFSLAPEPSLWNGGQTAPAPDQPVCPRCREPDTRVRRL